MVTAQGQDPLEFKHLIKTTPFSIIDSENPSFRLAYEYKVNRKAGVVFGAGAIYSIYDRKYRNAVESDNFGFILNAEFRNYTAKKRYSDGRFFIGIRSSYIKSDIVKRLMFSPISHIYGSPDAFLAPVRQEKRIFSIQPMSGYNVASGSHLFFEFAFALGVSDRFLTNNVPEFYGSPVFDRSVRADYSNKEYDHWFVPSPYFQIDMGWGW